MFSKQSPHAAGQAPAKKHTEREERIYNFLHANPIAVLSTVAADGSPHGCVIYINVDTDFVAWFLTKTATKKYDNLAHADRVMLTVFDREAQTVAQIIGTAHEVTDSYTINTIAHATYQESLETSNGGLPPITKLKAGEYVAFKVLPSQIRMAVYARPDTGEYADLFESIESFDLFD